MVVDRGRSTSREGRATRAGLEDVARRAGVGIATVGRVLNERGQVSPATAKRVIEAARDLGLRRILPVPHRRLVRFEVLLVRADAPFRTRLTQGFANLAATLDRSVLVQRTALSGGEPARVAERVRATKADGLIIYAEDHAVIRNAIANLTSAGTPVVCIVTDIPNSGRVAYVGIDNRKAGRTAGFLAARTRQHLGPVLVLTHSLDYRAHAERVNGFRDGLLCEAADARIAAVLEGHDEDDRVGRLLGEALRNEPEAAAVYNSGACLSVVAATIRKMQGKHGTVLIGHELTPETSALLRDGIMTFTIDQAFELQARRAVEVLLHQVGHIAAFPGPLEVPFTLHTRENA
jgi:LacI family transcriptional regulator